MKKILAIIVCAVSLALSAFSFGCGKSAEKVSVKYGDAQTIMQLLIDDKIEFGLLPEPVVTKLEKVRGKDFSWSRISLQDLYDETTKSYPQAVLMVKDEILNGYPSLVQKVKNKFADNVEWVKNNPDTAVKAVAGKYAETSLNPSKVIDKAVVENCNILWTDALADKSAVTDYITRIMGIGTEMGISPAKAVTDDFFFSPEGKTDGEYENKNFTFYAPDGAPALAIAKFISDGENFAEGLSFNYNVTVADEIKNYMNGAKGTADFIIIPVNLASILYKNSQASYKMVATVTHGNLYLVSKTAFTLKDLFGKKVGVTGEGKVPDLTLKYVFDKNNMEYETVV